MAFLTDGTVIASGSNDRTVRLWDVETGGPRSKIVSGGGWPEEVGGNGDFSIRIWDTETGTQIGYPLRGHSRYVTAVSLLLLVFKRVVCADY